MSLLIIDTSPISNFCVSQIASWDDTEKCIASTDNGTVTSCDLPSPVLLVQAVVVNQRWVVSVDESTEGETISPGRGHVRDPDPRVSWQLAPAPTLQTQHSTHLSTWSLVTSSWHNNGLLWHQMIWNIVSPRDHARTAVHYWQSTGHLRLIQVATTPVYGG